MNGRLRLIREKMGMNMRRFADFLGVKYTTYVGYENGSREPGSEFLTLVAKSCSTTTDYILGLTEEDGMLSQPDIVSATGEDPLSIVMSEEEYALLRAYKAADTRAREDALMLLKARPACM